MALIKKQRSMFPPSIWSDFFEDGERFFPSAWFNNDLNQTLPAVNIKENSKSFSVEFAAPGFEKKDFKVAVDQRILTISAERENASDSNENEHFTRHEFSYSSFSRSFTLPENTLDDKIDANYKNGVLTLTIPKKEISMSKDKKEIKVL